MKFKTDKNVKSDISRSPSTAQVIENTSNFEYHRGIRETFSKMREHCRNGHQVQDPNDGWFTSCFLLEDYGYNKDKWQCRFGKCPLIHGDVNE